MALSAGEFPGNWEKDRESFTLGPIFGKTTPKSFTIPSDSTKIP
jgi:hypothetical protein